MWKITGEKDDRWIFALGVGETFEGLSDEEKSVVYESAVYSRKKVEAELYERICEIRGLAESLTAEEWNALPKSVCEFFEKYKQTEEEDD